VISKRLVFVPKSRTATGSRLSKANHFELFDYPRPNGIIIRDQVMCEVSVQTFDTFSGAPYSPRGSRSYMTEGNLRISFLCVTFMSFLEFGSINRIFCSSDSPITFQTGNQLAQLAAD